ncbi:MAG: glycosyltransferase [Patescibacteria group bacterium]
MRKVLIITYFFPPVGGGAVIRTAKFVKYLPKFGWQPVVLTVDQKLSIQDNELTKEIPPEAIIIRTPPSPFTKFRSYLVQKFIIKKSKASQKKEIDPSPQNKKSFTKWLISRLSTFEYLMARLFFIPDQQIFWRGQAVKYAKKLIEEHQIDLIYTTCPPHSLHKIGQKLKKYARLPWVTDFRDVWTDTPGKKWGPWEKQVELRLEKEVVNKADAIICATEPCKEYLSRRTNYSDEKKFTVIRNGFDLEDFQEQKYIKKDYINITFFGGIDRPHIESFQVLLQAIENIGAEKPELKDKIRVNVFSSADPNLLRRENEPHAIPYSGFISHKQSLKEYFNSDLLLLILDDRFAQNSYPGKMFEYMASKRPILALVNQGIVKDFIENNNIGFTCPRLDFEKMRAVLRVIVEKWQKNELMARPSDDIISSHRRDALTKKLAELFNKIVSK